MSPAERTQRPLADELPTLLEQRGLTLRGVSRMAHVDHAHLSRVIRREAGKKASGEVAGRVAKALGLPSDFFPEYREAKVVEAVQADPELRERLYDPLSSG